MCELLATQYISALNIDKCLPRNLPGIAKRRRHLVAIKRPEILSHLISSSPPDIFLPSIKVVCFLCANLHSDLCCDLGRHSVVRPWPLSLNIQTILPNPLSLGTDITSTLVELELLSNQPYSVRLKYPTFASTISPSPPQWRIPLPMPQPTPQGQ